MTISLPIWTKTKDNQRQHWSSKARTSRQERTAAYYSVMASHPPPFPWRVTVTRCGPRKLDVCNLGSALKAIIDGVADAAGVDDGDERWEWNLRQRKQSLYGVEIEIQPLTPDADVIK